jgi:hypothetical protein
MANRISQIHVGKHSVWDVQFEIRTGSVTWDHAYADKHKAILKEGGWTGHGSISWVKSLRILLEVFQGHIDDPNVESGFDKIDVLHFVKLSIHKRGRSKYLAFQTQFFDENGDETEYTTEMFGNYGDILEIVWRHCVGVDKLVDDMNSPVLREEFLKLVDKNIIDNSDKVNGKRALMFYVKNPGVSPNNVKSWDRDSKVLGNLSILIGETNQKRNEPGSNAEAILSQFLEKAGELLGGS